MLSTSRCLKVALDSTDSRAPHHTDQDTITLTASTDLLRPQDIQVQAVDQETLCTEPVEEKEKHTPESVPSLDIYDHQEADSAQINAAVSSTLLENTLRNLQSPRPRPRPSDQPRKRNLQLKRRTLNEAEPASTWTSCCGQRVTPAAVKYGVQVAFGSFLMFYSASMLYIANTSSTKIESNLWIGLLTTTVGLFLPHPSP